MSKTHTLKLVMLLLLCMTVLVASAGSPHFVGTTSFRSGSLIFSGDLAGLGNENVTVRMDADAIAIAKCQNKGGNIAPGRNPIQITQTVSASVVPDENGRAHIELVALDPATINPPPVSPTPKQAGCPNGNWTVTGFMPGSTQWTGARLFVIDNVTHAILVQLNFICSGSGSSLVCTEV